MQNFYIARDGAAFGPVTIDETNRLVSKGELDLTTMIWNDDVGEWLTAAKHPKIAEAFESSHRSRIASQEKTLEALEKRCAARAAEEAAAAKRLAEIRAAHDVEITAVNEKLAAIRKETEDLEKQRIEAQALLGVEVSKAFGEIKRTINDLREMTGVWNDAQKTDEEARRVGLGAVEEIAGVLREREGELGRLLETLGLQITSEAERVSAQAAAAEAQARLEEITRELKSVTVLCYEESERLAKYREERESVRSEIIAEEDRIAALLESRGRLSSEISELTGTVSSLQVDLRSIQCENDALKRERIVHEGAIDDLRRLRGNVLESYMNVENDLAAFTSQATAAAARVAELERKVVTLEAEHRRCEQDFQETEAHVSAAREARREVELELEEKIRELGETTTRLEAGRGDIAELARVREEVAIFSGRRDVLAGEVEGLEKSLAERRIEADRMKQEQATLIARHNRLMDEIEGLEKARDEMRKIQRQLIELEEERATRGIADLGELREMLRKSELREKENIDRLLNESRGEYQRLRDEWAREERSGATNEELRKLRDEVEEKRREIQKAERQLSAMRAGLTKLREENSRTLLQRVQSFEMEQLEDLRRRIVESRGEMELLEGDWAKEMRSAELVDKQWLEVKETVTGRQ